MLRRVFLVLAVVALMAASMSSPAFAAGKHKGNGKHRDHKVTLCHNGQTILVDKHAAKAHLSHGDTPGPCPTMP